MNRKMQNELKASGRVLVSACVIFVLLSSSIVAQTQTKKPISEKGLLGALRIGGLTTSELVREVQQRGVDFELTAEIETKLRKAGAAPELIRAVGSNRRVEDAPVKPASVATREAPRVSLGLAVQELTPALAATLGRSDTRGVFVSTVEKESLADKAGVERRDVITALNDAPINNTDDLRRQIARLRTGEAISLTIIRNGSMHKLNTSGTSASGKNQESVGAGDRGVSGKGKLGLRVEPLTPEIAARFRLSKAKGLIVTDVDAAGPAAFAGIKIGDVIEEVNGQTVRVIADVEAALAKTNSGRIRLRINRGGESSNVELQPRTTSISAR